MMERENSNRTRRIALRLTPEEYTKIEQKYKASTCRKLSDYLRKHLLDKSITATYRNQSLDDFIEETVILRKELNAVGNNLNQAVKRLHTLQQIPEFKVWIISFEIDRKIISNKIDQIESHTSKITDKWLQS
ncbi:plasmid mobilization relaxosome protein MobC [Flavobacterium circumlabens]|uniref:Plasmid mobilization relaxosome protein MobC n=2 Tax=Flavobacterium circumlabens TaxID=2133765 RepID=A0A4Y7U6G7_9FLAO|nr:plasmid mobilization relaxosome protein MobC [Flavobacterium circumlabens]TEB41668.1 plasmid mobilization relaxosome protein MobC [Flavobacterium circumlabens]